MVGIAQAAYISSYREGLHQLRDLFSDRTHFQRSPLPWATQTTQDQIHPHRLRRPFFPILFHTH